MALDLTIVGNKVKVSDGSAYFYLQRSTHVDAKDNDPLIYLSEFSHGNDPRHLELEILQINGRPSDDPQDVADWLVQNFFFDVDTNDYGDTTLTIEYFTPIDASAVTSGSIAFPTGATLNEIILASIDNAYADTLNGSGDPTYVSPLDDNGDVVFPTLDSAGNWTVPATSSEDIALVYYVNVSLEDYNSWTALELSFLYGDKLVDSASDVPYDNTLSGLLASNVQEALDEIASTPSSVISVNGQTGVVVLDTDDISEGITNLYYTEARVSANTDVLANTAKVSADGSIATHSDVNLAGIVLNDILQWNGSSFVAAQIPTAPVTSVNSQTGIVVLDTDDISEGITNLYYTETRVSSNVDVVANTAKVSADGSISTHSDVSLTGIVLNDILQWNGSSFVPAQIPAAPVTSVNGQTGVVVLDTDDVSEGVTNLYYTEARVSANASVVANTAKVSADGSVTTHNDVTSAGSGEIITALERTNITDTVTVHSDVTSSGSGQIITDEERNIINGKVSASSSSTINANQVVPAQVPLDTIKGRNGLSYTIDVSGNLEIPIDGFYRVSFKFNVNFDNRSDIGGIIRVNGVDEVGTTGSNYATRNTANPNGSVLINSVSISSSLSAGDTIGLFAFRAGTQAGNVPLIANETIVTLEYMGT